jgi:hypothetical protein
MANARSGSRRSRSTPRARILPTDTAATAVATEQRTADADDPNFETLIGTTMARTDTVTAGKVHSNVISKIMVKKLLTFWWKDNPPSQHCCCDWNGFCNIDLIVNLRLRNLMHWHEELLEASIHPLHIPSSEDKSIWMGSFTAVVIITSNAILIQSPLDKYPSECIESRNRGLG